MNRIVRVNINCSSKWISIYTFDHHIKIIFKDITDQNNNLPGQCVAATLHIQSWHPSEELKFFQSKIKCPRNKWSLSPQLHCPQSWRSARKQTICFLFKRSVLIRQTLFRSISPLNNSFYFWYFIKYPGTTRCKC